MSHSTLPFTLLFCLPAFLGIVAGCSPWEPEPRYARYQMRNFPLSRTVPEPSANTPLARDLTSLEEPLDFLYVVGGFNCGVDDFAIVRIDKSGTCEHRFAEYNPNEGFVQRRVSFPLAEDELRQLRKVLADNDFFRLPLAYHANVHDGTIVQMKCSFAGWTKEVLCNNHFPTPVLNIHDEVMENMLKRHAGEIANAQRMPGKRSGVHELLESVGSGK